MNSQPAWWKSGRWNNPALLSRVVSGKRRFSIFSRRTGKTRRGVSEGFFSHPFEFLLPTLIRRYFRLSRRTEFPDNPGHIPKTVTPRLLPHPSVSTAAVHHRHIQQSQANKGRPSPRKAPSAYAGRVKKHPDQTFIRRSSRTARIYPGHSSRLPSSPDFRINHETY